MQPELQKYQLIQTITKIENDWMLQQISTFLQKLMLQNSAWGQVVKPLRKTTTLTGLKAAQNYQKPTQDKIDVAIQSLAIEEPIEELLAQLSK
ncbi:MAG: hypothetical protein ACKVTZ_05390 [Bacteroidia bacterium]